MNIFALHQDPIRAAHYQCDRHVVKMVLETAQLLSTVCHELIPFPYLQSNIYRPTHKNHPCTKWASLSCDNYMWLCEHGVGLAEAYTKRYHKTHKSISIINKCMDLYPFLDFEGGGSGPTSFAMAMPDQYMSDNAVVSYREYYIHEKSRFAKWKLGTPKWFLLRDPYIDLD
jgi:hypothetical protein